MTIFIVLAALGCSTTSEQRNGGVSEASSDDSDSGGSVDVGSFRGVSPLPLPVATLVGTPERPLGWYRRAGAGRLGVETYTPGTPDGSGAAWYAVDITSLPTSPVLVSDVAAYSTGELDGFMDRADLNGDLANDLIVGIRGDPLSVAVYSGAVAGSPMDSAPFASVRDPKLGWGSLLVGDLDGDGQDDLMLSDGNAWNAFVFDGPLTGELSFASATNTYAPGTFSSLRGDFDGDGADDPVAVDLDGVSVWTDMTPRARYYAPPLFPVAYADVDRDGYDDLVLSIRVYDDEPFGDPGPATWVLTHDAPSTGDVREVALMHFSVTADDHINSDTFGASVAAGDFDGDGAGDLVISGDGEVGCCRGVMAMFAGVQPGEWTID